VGGDAKIDTKSFGGVYEDLRLRKEEVTAKLLLPIHYLLFTKMILVQAVQISSFS
jgi:hypothetical protein